MADVAPQENNKRLVEMIKRDIKSEFSTDDEGILQFNKNGYQASINDILKTVDRCLERFERGNRK